MSEVVLSGTITAILPAEQGMSQRTGQPWVSQEYVLCHEQGQYPRSVCFRIFGQEKIQQAAIQMGEYITVHLNIDARLSQKNGKYFNSIDCWKVEHQQPTQGVPQGGYQQPAVPQQPQYQQQPMVQQPMAQQFPPQVNAQGIPMAQQPYQPQPAPGAAPLPPQQPVAQPQGQQPLPF